MRTLARDAATKLLTDPRPEIRMPDLRVPVKIATAAFLIALPAAAQTPANPYAPICPAGSRANVDSLDAYVTIGAGTAFNEHTYSPAARKNILFYADAIRQRFVPPSSLGAVPLLAEVPMTSWGGYESQHSAVGARLVIVVKGNGRLRDKYWQLAPQSRPLANALVAAVVAADTSHDFEGVPRALESDGDDTVVVQIRAVDRPGSNDLPMMRVRLATIVPDTPALRTKKGGLFYPSNAGNAGLEALAEVEYHVGADGKVIMPSVQFTRLNWRDFVRPVEGALRASEYAPASSGGCAIPIRMRGTFTFTNENAKPAP
jgi:hypothetical protein